MQNFIKILKIVGIVFVAIIFIQIAAGMYLVFNADKLKPINTINTESEVLSSVEATEENEDTDSNTATKSNLTDCSTLEGEWTKFSHPQTDLTFCYKNVWGTPTFNDSQISPSAKIGEIYYISFSKNNYFVQVSYATLDYKPLGDSDVPAGPAWSKIDFKKSEAELTSLFLPFENPVVKKIKSNKVNVLEVKSDYISPFDNSNVKAVEYFIPNVTINNTPYNLKITSNENLLLDANRDLPTLLQSFQLANYSK
jgi:hypothetical protein